jgi:hypothetical protein
MFPFLMLRTPIVFDRHLTMHLLNDPELKKDIHTVTFSGGILADQMGLGTFVIGSDSKS